MNLELPEKQHVVKLSAPECFIVVAKTFDGYRVYRYYRAIKSGQARRPYVLMDFVALDLVDYYRNIEQYDVEDRAKIVLLYNLVPKLKVRDVGERYIPTWEEREQAVREAQSCCV